MRTVFKRYEESLVNRKEVYRFISLSEGGSSFVVTKEGTILEGELPQNFSFSNVKLHSIVSFCGMEYFCDGAERDPEVLILGAGFVSRSVSDLLLSIGCHVTVADDRPEYLVPEFFDSRVERRVIDFEKLHDLPLHSYTGIIVVTRAHEYDSISLRQLRDCLDVYIGIMGSSKRIFYAKKQLAEEGWLQSELNALYAPIGLDIGAQTPEEIALSIVSEYLSVVRGKWPVKSLKMKGLSEEEV